MQKLSLTFAIAALTLAAPAHAFFDEIVLGMTSVTNNLIDSSESVANNTITTGSTTILVLSRDIGKMADRIDRMADKIGLMADRIGVMADRIVTTETMMAGLAHKLVDAGTAAGKPAAAAANLHACVMPAQPDLARAC
jgi:hypothetical protein